MSDFLIGDCYHNWKIIKKGSKVGYLLCECQCCFHTQQELRKSRMKNNEAAKCCLKCRQHKYDLTGQSFGRLTVLGKDTSKCVKKHSYYLCGCSCNNSRPISVRRDKLLDGSVTSCGCYQKEVVTKNLLNQIIGGWKVVEQVSPPVWETRPGAWWKLECLKCGEQKILKGIHINEQRVGFCSQENGTRGEVKIRSILQKNNILFKEQFTFSDLKTNKMPLRFDFAILNNNNEPLILIEYQGAQHYQPVDYFGGEVGFQKCLNRDALKKEYCLRNNIPLIIIPYTYYNNIKLEDLLLSSVFLQRGDD